MGIPTSVLHAMQKVGVPNLEGDDDEVIALFSSPTIFPTMNKPVMSKEVEDRVNTYLQQYSRRDKWKAWGLDTLRAQGGSLLLFGPPGTGKTSIAKYIAHKIGKGMKELDASKIPSGENPGDYERAIHNFFEDAAKRYNALIFMDECDSMLLSRDQMGEAGKTWQLGGVEALMMEMNIYKGPVICATNHVGMLDPALEDRFMDIIKIDTPDFEMRSRLWQMKIPKKFPFQLTQAQVAILSRIALTGRRIETVILNAASTAMRKNTLPTFQMFRDAIELETKKKLK